jgi:hypothetical protein
VEALQVLELRAVAHAHRLHHLGSGAARGLAAVRGPLVPVQLEDRQPAAVRRFRHLVERSVHEHSDQLEPAVQIQADLLARGERARARALRPEDHPERPCAQVRDAAGVLQVGHSTELHAGHARNGRSPGAD